MIPSRLFRASHSLNLDRIRNPLIFFENGCLLLRVLMIPSRLLRASHSLNLDRIRNPLIFFENGSLLMWYGLRIQKASCKQACVGFLIVTLGIIT